jgi:hypothetical protein
MFSNLTIAFALVAYVPATAACFLVMGGRRGMLAALLGGWLLMPVFNSIGHAFPLFHEKAGYVPAVVLAMSLLLDGASWRGFRARLVDLPMAVWCLAPFFTSVELGLGAYDGAAGVFETFTAWGAPYLLGRVYLRSAAAMLDAAKALVTAGLGYMVLALWEIRMSPQLHRQLYGFHQHSFPQHVRDGHYRPMLFMAHGLEVGLFFAACTMVAYWLWRTGTLRKLGPVPLGPAVLALGTTTFLCRSVGALVLLGVGVLVLEVSRRLRTTALVLVLTLLPAAYCTARIRGTVSVAQATDLAKQFFAENRAESLRIRVYFDQLLTDRALERPWLGWGRWAGMRLMTEDNQDWAIVDTLWIFIFGTGGLVALITAGVLQALAPLALVRAVPARRWGRPYFAAGVVLTMTVVLWTIDSLLNAMGSPIYHLMTGGVISWSVAGARLPRRRLRRALPAPEPVPASTPPSSSVPA